MIHWSSNQCEVDVSNYRQPEDLQQWQNPILESCLEMAWHEKCETIETKKQMVKLYTVKNMTGLI